MKIFKILILFILVLSSCKDDKQSTTETVKDSATTNEVATKTVNTEVKKESNGTFLCKINGKDWSYTKASGIVSRHRKTKKRTAIITFIKQLDKGKESVQLFYDVDKNILEEATAILKLPKKGGGKMSAMYRIQLNGSKRLPESEISGTIDLSNATAASGTAEVSKMKIRFEEGNLEDETMSVITFTPLNFSGIGYSDSEKLFGSQNND